MNKNILIVLVALLVVVAGFFYLNNYIYQEKQADETPAPAAMEEDGLEEPTTGVPTQGKINPQVACESALVYMTFENGAAADAFVAECVAGEHPEVIERYINEMGIDGAQI